MGFLNTEGLERLWDNIARNLETKVDKESDCIVLKDPDTLCRYHLFIKNGALTIAPLCVSIRVDSVPDRQYIEGCHLDLSDAVVFAVYEDGSERQVTNFTYPDTVTGTDTSDVIICYMEFGNVFTATANIVVTPLHEALVDFVYTKHANGRYTITGWKETLHGEPSTELVIPASKLINF